MTKQGQVLANALLAASAASDGFQNQFTIQLCPRWPTRHDRPQPRFRSWTELGRQPRWIVWPSTTRSLKNVPNWRGGRRAQRRREVLTEGVVIDGPLATAGAAARPPVMPRGGRAGTTTRWPMMLKTKSVLRCCCSRRPHSLLLRSDEVALCKTQAHVSATRWSTVSRTRWPACTAMMGSNIAYVGSDGRHFLFGHLFDMRTQTDLTAPKLTIARRGAQRVGRIAEKVLLPSPSDAIKTVRRWLARAGRVQRSQLPCARFSTASSASS